MELRVQGLVKRGRSQKEGDPSHEHDRGGKPMKGRERHNFKVRALIPYEIIWQPAEERCLSVYLYNKLGFYTHQYKAHKTICYTYISTLLILF